MRTKFVLVLALIALIVQAQAGQAAVCGDAYFNHSIDWPSTSALYYSVAGAPASTCGSLWASRNGSAFQQDAGVGWICTDASGNATKGPWTSNPDDETASVYIDWGTCTSPIRQHIWDVGPPTATVTSSCPSVFSGNAADEAWGAGFNSSWASCEGEFRNLTSGKWWNPSTGAYDSNSRIYVACTCSGMPSLNITWSCSSKPSSGSHVAGNSYTWYAWVYDGEQFNSPYSQSSGRCSFTY